MRALLRHVWLLLTLRHPGTGLPQRMPAVLALIVLASVFAVLRWEVLYEPYTFPRWAEYSAVGLAMFVWLLMIAQLHAPFAAAWALVSVAADCISMLLGPPGLLSSGVNMALITLQALALGRVAVTMWRRSRTRDHA